MHYGTQLLLLLFFNECMNNGGRPHPLSYSRSAWQRMRRASPDARCWRAHYTQAAMWRSVAHQRSVPSSSFILEFCSQCPLSSRNETRDFALHSVGASRKSRLAVRFRFSGGRCPGASSRPNTGQVMPLSRTVALQSLLFSAVNRAGNGPMLHQPAAFRG